MSRLSNATGVAVPLPRPATPEIASVLWANLLYLIGVLSLVAAAVGVFLLLFPATRVAGVVIALLFGVVGAAALAMATLEVVSLKSEEQARLESQAAAVETLRRAEIERDNETLRREEFQRQRAGYAPDGMAYITGAPAGAAVARPDVAVFQEAALKTLAKCRHTHGALIKVVRESDIGPRATEVMTGDCSGWVARAHIIRTRPTQPVARQ